MNRLRSCASVFLLIGILGAAPKKTPTPQADLAALLKRQTQELMDAVAPGKGEVWERYLLPTAVYLDENGVVYDKPTLIKELTPLPAGIVGRIVVDKFQPTFPREDTAIVAAEVQEYVDYHGQQIRTRFRFLDTWLKTRDGWRLAGRQTEAILKDPPAITLSKADLCAYSGEYRLTPQITTKIACTEKGLTSERTGRPPATYLPEVRDVFFVAGQPRTRRIFQRDASGALVAFVDRREGEDIRWAKNK